MDGLRRRVYQSRDPEESAQQRDEWSRRTRQGQPRPPCNEQENPQEGLISSEMPPPPERDNGANIGAGAPRNYFNHACNCGNATESFNRTTTSEIRDSTGAFIIYGNQTLHCCPEPKVPEKIVSKPVFMVPSFANPNFVGREEILHKLESRLAQQPRVALYGLGGIGKTTIAIEFCYQRKKSQPNDHIFWVHCHSHEAFNNSFLELGRNAAVVDDDANGDKGLKDVRKWLESPASNNWLMVIDNFDEIDSYPENYLPKNGAILFTTRDERLVGNLQYVPNGAGVKVDSMSDKDGVEMLLKLLVVGEADDEGVPPTDAHGLVQHLQYHPLAIAQAAAYIRQTRIEIPRYLKMFEHLHDQQKLLNFRMANRDFETPTSRMVMTTWQVTIGKIREESLDSVQLLEYMSFLSTDDIPEALLRDFPFLKHKSDAQFYEAFAPLLNYSLISRHGSSHYRLHSLVALCIRTQIDSEDTLLGNSIVMTLCRLLMNRCATDLHENQIWDLELAVHAAAVLEYQRYYQHDFEFSISLLLKAAHILVSDGRADHSMPWYQHAIDGTEIALGHYHQKSVSIAIKAAESFHYQGDYRNALLLYQRALDGQEKTLGKGHPGTLLTVFTIGSVFHDQRDYCKALEWFQRGLDCIEKTFWKGSEVTLLVVCRIGRVFYDQGDYCKALEWFQRALDGQEKTLGKEHQDTLVTAHRMASIFRQQGDYSKALEWFQRALDGREKTLGKEHQDTLATVNNIGWIFCCQGDYRKALEWLQRELDGQEKTLGKDHQDTLATVATIGQVFCDQGDYLEALESFQRALDCIKTFGKCSEVTLLSVCRIGRVFYDQGDYPKALGWFQRALDGQEKTLGKDHRDTLVTVSTMGNVFYDQGDYCKALEWYQRALDGEEKTLGKDHRNTLVTVNDMGNVFYDQGDYCKALEWYQRAFDGREKTLGKDHRDTLATVNNMGSIFRQQGDYCKALEWIQRSLDGQEKTLGKEHPDTLATVSNMASLFLTQRDFDKALAWYQRALNGREKLLGKDHPKTLDAVYGMGSTFHKQGDFDKALALYQRAHDGYEKRFGNSHPMTLKAAGSAAEARRSTRCQELGEA